jgi:hypothetical protein
MARTVSGSTSRGPAGRIHVVAEPAGHGERGLPGRLARSGGGYRRLAALAVGLASIGTGCSLGLPPIDLSSVQEARLGFAEYEKYPVRKPPAEADKPEKRSVFLAELIAIFPGFFVHGLGHRYAGDYQTARKLSHVGQVGYLLTAVGGGMVLGGHYLAKEDEQWRATAYGLYGVGGTIGVVGVGCFLTAWFYDMIDTPRAIDTYGEPPPRSDLLETMDLFE